MKTIRYDPILRFFVIILGVVVISIVLKELQHIFIPLFIAYLLFFLFEPLNKFIEQYGIPSWMTTIVDIIIISGFLWGVSRIIIVSFSEFGNELPMYESKLNHIISNFSISLGIKDKFFTEFNISQYLKNLNYGSIAGGFFTSTLSVFSAGFFVLFFFIFVRSGYQNFIEVIKRRYVQMKMKTDLDSLKKANKNRNLISDEDTILEFKKRESNEVENTFKDIIEQIQQYISIKALISLVDGIMFATVLGIFGVDFLVVWAVLAFLLNFIPNIGPSIAVLLASLMALVQFGSFGEALLVAAILVAIQNLIGNIIEPKVLGNRLGINPMVILLSLLIWGYIWGIVGMFLAIPITAVIKIIMTRSNSENLHFLSNLMGN